MPQYSDERIKDRNKSGKDAERAAKNTELFNKATQPPHDDDMWAKQQLAIRGGDDSQGGLATNDARNHALMMLSKLDPQAGAPEYHEERDGGGLVGSIGGVLKKLAPMAGLIPGIGMPIGALAGAAGSALGGAMSGDKFDLGSTLGAGIASGGAAALNPFGSKIPDAPDIHAMGDQGHTPTGKPYIPSQHVPGAPGHPGGPSAGGGGILSKLGKIDLNTAANVAGKGMEVLDRRSTRKANERFQNASLNMRTKQLGMAEDSYAERAPLRSQAISRLGRMRGASIFGGG